MFIPIDEYSGDFILIDAKPPSKELVWAWFIPLPWHRTIPGRLEVMGEYNFMNVPEDDRNRMLDVIKEKGYELRLDSEEGKKWLESKKSPRKLFFDGQGR